MAEFIVCVREPGSLEIDYALNFEAPELPRIGDYISIQRPDKPAPFGEDMIVRAVWWRLFHPEVDGFAAEQKVGGVTEIFVECEPALSPYSSENWKLFLGRRADTPELQVVRFAVDEETLRKAMEQLKK